MKILAFVDMHGNLNILKRIVSASRKADIIVCAGDFTVFEKRIEKILLALHRTNKEVLVIPGNHESLKRLEHSCSHYKNLTCLHAKAAEYKDCLFLGYGGMGFTVVDREFEKLSRHMSHKISEFKKANHDGKIILVTHAPPYKTRLDAFGKEHVGNRSIRHFIYENNINLSISGHLHENKGKEDRLWRTKLINPFPYKIINI